MQVKETKNYEMFKYVNGNRQTNNLHIKRLKESMSKEYLVSPIIVNENNEVIDGQHRLQVVKELKLPVRFIVCKGYGLPQVQRFNQNSKNWGGMEFINAYADLGYDDYKYLIDFMYDHDLSHAVAASLLSDQEKINEKIKDGEFKINQKSRANIIADWINILKTMFAPASQRNFVRALLSLYKNDNFNFSHFVGKLTLQPTSLVPCTNNTQYITLIEDIYNYKNRNKVNLRY
jgi:hypothetical protein